MPINGTAHGSPDLSRGQSALSVPGEKNAHFLGEQKMELWLKPLCLQEQFFNPFVWCMKSVPRTRGLLITVGHFPSLQINWQKPLVPSFSMLLSFRAGKWPPPWDAYSFLRDLGIAQRPPRPQPNKRVHQGASPACLSSRAGSACWRLCFRRGGLLSAERYSLYLSSRRAPHGQVQARVLTGIQLPAVEPAWFRIRSLWSGSNPAAGGGPKAAWVGAKRGPDLNLGTWGMPCQQLPCRGSVVQVFLQSCLCPLPPLPHPSWGPGHARESLARLSAQDIWILWLASSKLHTTLLSVCHLPRGGWLVP